MSDQRHLGWFIAGILWCGISVAQTTRPAEAPKDDLAAKFAAPGPEYRGKPFWSWNGELKVDELTRQIGALKDMGMGGFFMHSRTGLITEYLGDEWFKLINACADEAQKLGMEAWLYDEDRWPSGTAGGLVTARPEFRARFMSLRMVPAEKFKWEGEIYAAFACDLKGMTYTEAARIQKDTPAAQLAGKTILFFTIEEMARGSFYNGYTYVDTLNREATDYFIQLTHEKYKQKCGDRLGKSIKGIFTDEPHRGPVMNGFGLANENKLQMTPWTAKLPDEFKKRFGYDIVERLPELFLRKDGKPVAQVKWHYMELLQSMFLENFARPIYQWCQKNNMIFTGHVLHEDALTCQAAMQGSLMRFYESMHYPGVDVLTEGNRNYWIVKQLSSVARQMGQKWMLSELYGCTGWQFDFESHKAVGDWQALFGINLRCPHLSWYTMEGEAKRDYPASIFYQSAWYKDYHFVEDYYARLGLVLSQGKPVCDTLVINPVESVWCQVGLGWANGLSAGTSPIQNLEQHYQQLFNWLTGAHIDFDYGDEEMLSRLAKIEWTPGSEPVVKVGQASYRQVVVGRMTTIRATTLKLLADFQAAGGKVIFVGKPPEYLDAMESSKPAELAANCRHVPWGAEALAQACEEKLSFPVSITDAATGKNLDQIFCQIRADGPRKYLVAMNMSRDQAYRASIAVTRAALPENWRIAEWDCESGQIFSVVPDPAPNAKAPAKAVKFTVDFPPVGEHVFVLEPRTEPTNGGPTTRPSFAETGRVKYDGPFDYRLTEKNVCVLDFAKWQLNDQPLQEETEILKVDRAVRTALSMPLRGGEMVQPWYRNKFEPAPKPKAKLRLTFGFFVETIPAAPIQFAMEHPELFSIRVNNKPLMTPAKGWWVDPAIQTIPLGPKRLVEGQNEIELEVGFHEGINLEAIYLLGNFGVKLEATKKTLTALPEKLAVGDLSKQGLPFYSGAVKYRILLPPRPGDGDDATILVPKFEGACVKVTPLGQKSRMVAWPPYQAHLTDVVGGGIVEIEVVLTRRNTFGPLHQVPLRAPAYGPGNWITEGKAWSNEYQLYPAGLLEAPTLIWGETAPQEAHR